MPNKPSGQNILRYAALENYAVAFSLRRLHERAITVHLADGGILQKGYVARRNHAVALDRFIGCHKIRFFKSFVLIIALAAAMSVFLWPTIYKLVVNNWKSIILAVGGLCVGAGLIFMMQRTGKSPLKNIQPPDETTEKPLEELERLAERTTSRLRTAYHIQLCLVGLVAAIFFAVITWCIFMVSQGRLMYATAFGSSGVGMLALSKWKWQPFDRIAEARKLADDADILTTGLRLRIKSVSEIDNPKERARAQWDAVRDYLCYS